MFIDYYEVLEVSPNANLETIERIFRHLAKRYHPDNPHTGDLTRFSQIVEAHNTLRDPVSRARYDVQYNEQAGLRSKLTHDVSDTEGIARDVMVQNKLLALLYAKRLHNIEDPGIGSAELERLSDQPREHLDFHLWYLKAKGWIAREETGVLAITVAGIDHLNENEDRKTAVKRLTHEAESQTREQP